MEISHADFTEVTWVVLVEIGAVVMLTTGHTTTTGVLPVFADTSVTGGDVAAAAREMLVRNAPLNVDLYVRHSRAAASVSYVVDIRGRTVSASWLLG